MERADKTARILDVKYFLLLPHGETVGGVVDQLQWIAVLKTVVATRCSARPGSCLSPQKVWLNFCCWIQIFRALCASAWMASTDP